MKMALDIWYELWEKTDAEGGSDPNRHPDEEGSYYSWQEDYLAWIRGKETSSDSR